VSFGNLPAGVALAQALPLQISAGSKQQIAFTATSAVTPGSISVSIQGNSGSLSHSANASLQVQGASVPDFRMALDNNALALQPGNSQSIHLTVSPLNQFADTVAVAISGLPKGVSVVQGSTFNVAAGATATVTFAAAKNAGVANTNVTLTGTDGALSHAQNASLQVLASTTTPTYTVTYFDSSIAETAAPDESIRIVNSGVQSTPSALGDLCANIYVFDRAQELKECCSCLVTANGYITLSVTSNLTNNPSNGLPFTSGSVDVVPSAATSGCDPTMVSPVPSLNVWSTHIANKGTGFGLVETKAPSTPLSGPELSELQSRCGFIFANQSGNGVCSCSID
jgi:Tfp pilus assembly protein PilV